MGPERPLQGPSTDADSATEHVGYDGTSLRLHACTLHDAITPTGLWPSPRQAGCGFSVAVSGRQHPTRSVTPGWLETSPSLPRTNDNELMQTEELIITRQAKETASETTSDFTGSPKSSGFQINTHCAIPFRKSREKPNLNNISDLTNSPVAGRAATPCADLFMFTGSPVGGIQTWNFSRWISAKKFCLIDSIVEPIICVRARRRYCDLINSHRRGGCVVNQRATLCTIPLSDHLARRCFAELQVPNGDNDVGCSLRKARDLQAAAGAAVTKSWEADGCGRGQTQSHRRPPILRPDSTPLLPSTHRPSLQLGSGYPKNCLDGAIISLKPSPVVIVF
ncbi:hypothetical protein J6590_012240 [Homalodisca vitripennis]|nr:hypothetical protein J6590_012240 [Homalodisca vitripennis]